MDNYTFEEQWKQASEKEKAHILDLELKILKYEKALQDIINIPPGKDGLMFDIAFVALKDVKKI